MKIIVEFNFPKDLNEFISDEFIFGDILKSIPFSDVDMKVINRIYSGKITFDSIEKAVCAWVDCRPEELQVKTRKREVVEARQICHYLSKNTIPKLGSLSKIGERFGNKDHATVLHSIRTVTSLISTDSEYKEKYQTFIESFKNETAKA
jgi:chromosomal replication initiator protein